MPFFKSHKKIILLMFYMLLQAVEMNHGARAGQEATNSSKIKNDDSCETFIHQWIDAKNKKIPSKLKKRIQKYLGKEVLYPESVSTEEAPFFIWHPTDIQKKFKAVSLAQSPRFKIDSDTVAAGTSIEMLYGSSPLTFKLKELKSASIQNQTFFIGHYVQTLDDSMNYFNLYTKSPSGEVKELMHGTAWVSFFSTGKDSPVFVIEKQQAFDAHFQGTIYQLMKDGSLKKLEDLWAFKFSWDINDFEGNGSLEFMESEEIEAPPLPVPCEGHESCFLRELTIEKWDGVQFKLIADYFYIEPCDVVRGG